MFSKTLFLENSTAVGSNQPKSLYKREPITIQLNPTIVLAGVLIMLFFVSIGLGLNDSYNFWLSGV